MAKMIKGKKGREEIRRIRWRAETTSLAIEERHETMPEGGSEKGREKEGGSIMTGPFRNSPEDCVPFSLRIFAEREKEEKRENERKTLLLSQGERKND